MTDQRSCPVCGAAAAPSDRFCGACGAGIEVATAAPEPAAVAPEPSATPEPSPTTPASAAPLPAVDTTPAPSWQAATEGVTAGADAVAPPPTDDPQLLAKFPMWQAIVFNILSGGLWGTYWVYRVRRQQARYLGREDDAVLQAVGANIPIWNVFVVRNVWREADEMIVRAGTEKVGYRDFTIIFAILYGVGVFFSPALIGIPVLYIIVQSRLNKGLDALSGGTAPDMRFTFWSLFWIVLPILLFVGLILLIGGLVAAAGSA
jgi:hypothetical protein